MRFMEKKPFAGLSLLLMALLIVVAGCAPQEEAAVAEEGEMQEVAMQETPQAIPMRSNSEARPSPNASVTQTIGTTIVTITYGRPGVKGRQVFGGLEE